MSAPPSTFAETTVNNTAVGSAPVGTAIPQLDRYVRQRDEWQQFTCTKLVPTIERVLRELHEAAAYAAAAKGTRDVGGMFRKIICRIPHWSDEECEREFSQPATDIDACIRMAVKAHATVMALTIDRPCKQVIKVPNSVSFFRKVLVEVALDHEVALFGNKDLDSRQKLRKWIAEAIVRCMLNLVPIALFTCESPVLTPSPPLYPITPAADAGAVPAQSQSPISATPLSPVSNDPSPAESGASILLCNQSGCDFVSTPEGAKAAPAAEPPVEIKKEPVEAAMSASAPIEQIKSEIAEAASSEPPEPEEVQPEPRKAEEKADQKVNEKVVEQADEKIVEKQFGAADEKAPTKTELEKGDSITDLEDEEDDDEEDDEEQEEEQEEEDEKEEEEEDVV